jgi:chromosome partitioning protein
MPSEIDIHATAKCIADLLLVAKIRRSENRIGIIANRVRSNTRVSQSLTRFLNSLDIPLIATLRDTQNYVRSAEVGVGVYEMPRWQVQQDLTHWQQLLGWLGGRRATAADVPPSSGPISVDGQSPEPTLPHVAPHTGFVPASGGSD